MLAKAEENNPKKKTVITVFAILLVILWLAGDAPRLLLTLGFSPA